jgi:predicted small integral membrane protein
MTLRLAKVLLVSAVALFYTMLVFNNTTDYGSNHQFVQHVLLMDTTFPGNQAMWRAIHSSAVHTAFYCGIIAWEAATMVLTWIGVVQLIRALRSPSAAFNSSKRLSIMALTLGMMLWYVAFICVGGEWFLMWQSKTWNGQEAASRAFVMIGVVFILLVLPDTELSPDTDSQTQV